MCIYSFCSWCSNIPNRTHESLGNTYNYIFSSSLNTTSILEFEQIPKKNWLKCGLSYIRKMYWKWLGFSHSNFVKLHSNIFMQDQTKYIFIGSTWQYVFVIMWHTFMVYSLIYNNLYWQYAWEFKICLLLLSGCSRFIRNLPRLRIFKNSPDAKFITSNNIILDFLL